MDQVNILKMVRSVEDQEEVKNTISSLLENLYKTGVNKTTQSKSEYEKKITEEILSDLNGKNTVFDIDTDSDILGGVILSTKKGLYKDFSLSKKLNDVFAEKRKEIFF